jgi:hypothetical protein
MGRTQDVKAEPHAPLDLLVPDCRWDFKDNPLIAQPTPDYKNVLAAAFVYKSVSGAGTRFARRMCW